MIESLHSKPVQPRKPSGCRKAFAGALRFIAAVCVAALAVPSSARGAGQTSSTGLSQYVQTSLTSRNGLPQNSVRSVAQSTDGYMWLGTEEGLVRYDGNRTKVYDRRTDPGLQDNYVQSVAAASDGSLWVGTRRGVSHYSHGAFVSHTDNGGRYLGDVLADNNGNVWVASVGGLFSVSRDGRTLVPFAGIAAGTDVRQLSMGGDGSVWLATSTGVWHLKHGAAHRHGTEEGLPESEVQVITAARDGSLWCATPTELLHWKSGLLSRRSIDTIAPHGRVTALLEDGSGKLWIGLAQDGIATLSGNAIEHFNQANGLPSNAVNVLRVDRDSNLWVGFNDGGAVRFHSGLFHTYGNREGLSAKSVWTALSVRDGSVWAVTPHGNLNHLLANGHVDVLTARDGLPTGELYSMFADSDDSIWAGNDLGDLIHIVGGHQVRVFHNARHAMDALRCILRGPGGELYLLYHSNFGLESFRDGTFTVQPHNVPGLPTVAVRAGDGSLWIGTSQGGISHWNGRLLEVYGPRQGFGSEFVFSMVADAQGSVWVGTSPGGLSLLRNGRVTTFTQENGLFDDTVGSITEDENGYLWMTSNKGIFKVQKSEMVAVADGKASAVQSIAYGLPDGLRSAECNYSTTPAASLGSDGKLWFATTEGLVSVRPSASTIRTSQPVAVVEKSIVDGKPMAPDTVATRAGAHDVEFDFAAPDFAAPERLRFRYKLNGFDRDWIEAGNRTQAFYTRLPPGHYELQVEAEDGSGWPDHAASMMLLIPPHFWQTTWFCGAGILLLLLIGFGAYEARVLALRRGQRLLQEQVVVRTAELQEAMRVAEAAHQELQELATRDSMTRLWNRRQILNMLRSEANRAEREGLSLCVLMLDVDHFKAVNDSKGHLAGDRVLQAVANVLIEQTRPYDCAGRYGGEEFLIILCNCSLKNGVRRADKIRRAVAEICPEWNGHSIPVTASFGVALHHSGKTIEAVLQEADEALYRAKQSGRDRVCTAVGVDVDVAAEATPQVERSTRGRTGRRALDLQAPTLNPA